MTEKRDYYDVLGISKNADDGAIKKAYRKLAKKYHPDTNQGDKQAEQRFKEVTEAYNVLSDPERKKIYDQFGHAGLEGGTAGGSEEFYQGGSGGAGRFYRSSSGGPGGFYQEFHFGGDDMDDMFGDMFGSMFQRKGEDLHAEIEVSFDEAAFGGDKIITLQDERGIRHSLQVHIPAGIDDGKSIRLRGKGAAGVRGGEPGDLLLKVKVMEKAGFERRGLDIYTTVKIPFTTAVFGGEAIVPTLNGKVVCKIREGTQSGTKIRLRGKGIVSMSNATVHGDQYVTVQIQVPEGLSQEAKRKLKEFEDVCKRDGKGRNGTYAA